MKMTAIRTNRAGRLAAGALALMILGVLCMGTAFAAQATDTAKPAPGAAGAALTFENALAIALEKMQWEEGSVLMTALKEDKDDGRRLFEIEFIAGGMEYEVEIDAKTGEVIKSSMEKLGKKKQNMAAGTYLAMEEAKQKALEQAGLAKEQATFTGLELDFEDGRAEYEVEFTDGTQAYQVKLDAATGEVLRYKTEAGHKGS